MITTIVFVYNADSGFINAVKDHVHKIVKPATYPCQLCAVTFGNLGMKPKWKAFVSALPVAVEFTHKDEFTREHGKGSFAFPAAYAIDDNGTVLPFIQKEQVDAATSIDELRELVLAGLDRLGIDVSSSRAPAR